MRAPSRFRRIAKWTGLVVCVMILATWAVSTRYIVVRSTSHGSSSFGFGKLLLNWYETVKEGRPTYYMVRPTRTSFKPGLFILPHLRFHPNRISLTVPFWLLLTLPAIPTAILWHRDRRTVKPGCCRVCGYDLRSSKKTCPECGTAIAPEPR